MTPRMPQIGRDHRRGERGAVTIWTLIVVPALFMVAGLVVDGGAVLRSHVHVQNLADEAARAGADSLSEASLRSGQARLNPEDARHAATEFLADSGVAGTVAVDGNTVSVTTRTTQRMRLLSAFGVGAVPVSGHARARSVGGITQELP